MRRRAYFFLGELLLLLILTSCRLPVGESQFSLLDQAAQEATQIIEEAQATAMVVKAQVEATQIANQANAGMNVPTLAPTHYEPQKTDVQATPTVIDEATT